jgi:hypothetical protein
VKFILEISFNDCNSNNTRYPCFSYVQQVDWWTNKHIINGKKELNLDDFAKRPLRYQYKKMEEIQEQVKEGEMPLNSYLWIHKDARLTTEEKNKIMSWANGIQDSLKAHYPMDSLVRKKTSS